MSKKSLFPGVLCFPRCAFFGAAVLSTVVAQTASAAEATWSGNTTANWSALDGFNVVPTSGDTLIFDAAGSAGTTLNNDLFTSPSSTVQGPNATGAIVFTASAPAYTINGGAFQLGSNTRFQGLGFVFNNSSNVQTINSNVSSLAYNFSVAAGAVAFGGTNTLANPRVVGGATMIITGTTTSDAESGSFAGAPFLGDDNAGSGTMNVEATGVLNVNGNPDGVSFLLGQQTTGGVSNQGILNLNGGAINVNARTGVTLGNSGGTGTLNINSGTMTVTGGGGGTFIFGSGSPGTTNRLNLNAGTLATGRSFSQGTGGGEINLGGGTLKALADQTSWVAAGITVTTTSAASQIDSNGFDVTIANAISGSGGLTIIDSSGTGTGSVILTGANSYSGDTTVTSGQLSINTAYLSDIGFVDLATGAVLDLAFTGSDTVAGLFFNGVAQAVGTWGATGSGAQNINDDFFSGAGTLNVVPEPGTLAMLALGGAVLIVFGYRRRRHRASF